MDTAFHEPILARVPGQDGRSELLEIRTVREALSAINRRGLGNYDFSSEHWQRAAGTLQDAIRHPCQEAANKARVAFLALAQRTPARLDS